MTGATAHDPVLLGRMKQAQAAAILTAAFMNDPMYRALMPDDSDRRRSLDHLWRAIVGFTMAYGRVYTTSLNEGVACWASPGNTVTLWRLVRTGFGLQRAVMRFRPEPRKRLWALLTIAETMHRESIDTPHWYLWALGVVPASHNRGVGSAILEPVLVDSDMSGIPCYLETQTPKNVVFYEKHGFRVASEADTDLPGIRLWAMVRDPR